MVDRSFESQNSVLGDENHDLSSQLEQIGEAQAIKAAEDKRRTGRLGLLGHGYTVSPYGLPFGYDNLTD